MIVSTLYLPRTAVNLQHQHATARDVCADQDMYSVMTGTVRWWLLVIARPQVSNPVQRALRAQHRHGRAAVRSSVRGYESRRHQLLVETKLEVAHDGRVIRLRRD